MIELETHRLGDLVVSHNAARRPIKASDRVPGSTPYYGASGVVDSVEGFTHEGEFLLVSEDGENLRSRSTPIAFNASGQIWVNNHAHVLTGREPSDTRFLVYALAVTDLTGYLTGSAQPKLSKAALDSIVLRLPGSSDREAIADVLGALDDKIAANTTVASLTEELIAAHHRAALADPETSPRPLFEVLDITFGEAFKGEGFCEPGTGRPLIRIRDLKTATPQVWTTEARAKETVIQPGDVLVGMDAEFRSSWWLGQPGLLNQRVLRATSKLASPAFVAEALRQPLATLEGEKSATTVIHLNKSDLDRSTVFVPGAAALARFDAVADPLRVSRVALATESRILAATRDELLPLLMSGKVRVKDAEKTLEGVL